MTTQQAELIQEGRNQVLYLLLALGDENVAHDNWHPDQAKILVEARQEIVKRLKLNAPYYPSLGGKWPKKWPNFDTYTCCPG